MRVTSYISTKNWHYEQEELSSYYVELFFAFRDNGKEAVIFNNLFFGYTLTLNGQKISEGLKPEPGITYISTDQDYLEVITIDNLLPEKEYVLNVWSKNNEEFWEDSFSFILPIPPAPFTSWTWNSEESMWTPPIPYPDDDTKIYSWNEENQNWDIIGFD